MTVDRGVVGGGDGYSAGGAGGNDSITLVVVARWREKRSKLAAESSGGDGDGGGVVAAAESSPWFFSFHGKGDDFCEMVCPRRGGWEGPDRYEARCGGGTGTTSAALMPRSRRHLVPAREFVPRVALVLARRVSCVALFSSRTGRRHPTWSIGHGAGG